MLLQNKCTPYVDHIFRAINYFAVIFLFGVKNFSSAESNFETYVLIMCTIKNLQIEFKKRIIKITTDRSLSLVQNLAAKNKISQFDNI